MTTIHASHAKESGHWYDRHAKRLVELVRYANGNYGAPTLTHASKLGLVPGTTKIIQCASAYSLENWKRKQVLMAALTLPRKDGETDEQFVDRILADADEESKAARDRGTAIHAAIQEYYTTLELPDDPVMRQHVLGAVQAVEMVAKLGDGSEPWIPEQCVVHCSGYGTKVDLHGPGVVIDFKSKDFGRSEKECMALRTYRDHWMQLAAGTVPLDGEYASADVTDMVRTAIIYVSRSTPGLSWPVLVTKCQLRRGWEMFQYLLGFWKSDNQYDPSWVE